MTDFTTQTGQRRKTEKQTGQTNEANVTDGMESSDRMGHTDTRRQTDMA